MRNLVDAAMPEVEKAVSQYKLDESYKRAIELVTSGRARDAFQLDREAAPLRDRYGRNTFGQSQLLARRLVEAGTRVVEVAWPKVANSDNHSWDVHKGLHNRMKNQAAPTLDAGLSSLIADFDERGLLKETLVVAIGEFGRSPQRVSVLLVTTTATMVAITGRIVTRLWLPEREFAVARCMENRTRQDRPP